MQTHGRRVLMVISTVFAMVPAGAHAASFTVNSTADTTDVSPGNGSCATAAAVCTLRAAIVEANALFGADEITVPAGTYVTGAALTVSGSTTITAPAGPRATIVDGAPGFTVLNVTGGTTTVRGLALTGGWTGLEANGTDLTVDQVAIRDNAQTLSGASFGTGLFVRATAKVVMTRSAIINNSATSTASEAKGAGVYLLTGGELTAETTTIAGNTVSGSPALGGGIMSFGKITLRNSTVANNNGGNANLQSGADVRFTDSIVTGCSGVLLPSAGGQNIDTGTSCGFGAGHLSSTDPQLQPLGDYGGPTDTAPPSVSSPALDRALACPTGGIDQRGSAAPSGASCDIGAAEFSTDLGVALDASRTSVARGGDVTYVARVTNSGPDAAVAATLNLTVTGAEQIVVATSSTGTCTTAVRCELGTIARGATVTITIVARAGAPGTLTATAVAASIAPDPTPANNQVSVSTTIDGSGAGGGPGGGGPADTTAPALGSLRLSGKARTGRAVTLLATLSESASVAMKVERLQSGRRTGKSCSTKAKRGKRCTKARNVGTITVTATAGTTRLLLPAKLGSRKLAAGRYRISATATDAAGNRSTARTLTITVKR